MYMYLCMHFHAENKRFCSLFALDNAIKSKLVAAYKSNDIVLYIISYTTSYCFRIPTWLRELYPCLESIRCIPSLPLMLETDVNWHTLTAGIELSALRQAVQQSDVLIMRLKPITKKEWSGRNSYCAPSTVTQFFRQMLPNISIISKNF